MRYSQNNALTEFAGGLAHELANIFTAAAGNLSLLDEGCRNCQDCGQALNDIRHATKRGFDLTSALKAIAGRQILNPSTIDLNREIETALSAWRSQHPKAVKIGFAPTAESCAAKIDGEKFRAMIDMLAENAIEAMPEGGRLHLSTAIVGTEGKGGLIRIEIRDTGIGMSEDMLQRAFDPMVTSKRPNLRHGWGLAICAGFVRQSGGRIALDSKPRQGTCVTVWLPRA